LPFGENISAYCEGMTQGSRAIADPNERTDNLFDIAAGTITTMIAVDERRQGSLLAAARLANRLSLDDLSCSFGSSFEHQAAVSRSSDTLDSWATISNSMRRLTSAHHAQGLFADA
jgi:hypothetical protein